MCNDLLYIYRHIHTYIHTHIHTYIHTYIHTHIHTYIHTHIHTYTHTYKHFDMLSTLKTEVGCWRTSTILQSVTIHHSISYTYTYCYNMQQILLCTVTTEKAAKHIATRKIRKWPHRETFNASSRYCVNLWIKRRGSVHLKN